jgi:hypothetical protein
VQTSCQCCRSFGWDKKLWDCERDKKKAGGQKLKTLRQVRLHFRGHNARAIRAGERNVTGDVAINVEKFGA